MTDDPNLPNLNTNRIDGLTSLAKGVIGAAPYVGPILAEIVGHVIPKQRIDRITEFVQMLDERLKGLEREQIDARMQLTENVDLLEDAFTQAARATSAERIEYIANVVAHGVSVEEMNHAETKRMLWLLGQLNDSEIVFLRSYLPTTREDFTRDSEFQQRHAELLAPDATHMGSSEEEFEKEAIKTSYRQHLYDLGLIRRRFKSPKRGELPDFDAKTGMMKTNGSELARLGQMFLRYLDLIPEWYQY